MTQRGADPADTVEQTIFAAGPRRWWQRRRTWTEEPARWWQRHRARIVVCATPNTSGVAWSVVSDHTPSGDPAGGPVEWASGWQRAGDGDANTTAAAVVATTTSAWPRRTRLEIVVIRPSRHTPTRAETDAWQRCAAHARHAVWHQDRDVSDRGPLLRAAQQACTTTALTKIAEPGPACDETLRVACDASFDTQRRQAAWAWATPDGQIGVGNCDDWVSGSIDAEMFAVTKTVEAHAGTAMRLRIVTDCQIVAEICQHILSCGELPPIRAVRRQRTARHWRTLAATIAGHADTVEVFWVRGHHTDHTNQLADFHAKAQVRELSGRTQRRRTRRGSRGGTRSRTTATAATTAATAAA